jgi:hypothetical protein
MQYITDELFVGNRLSTAQIVTRDSPATVRGWTCASGAAQAHRRPHATRASGVMGHGGGWRGAPRPFAERVSTTKTKPFGASSSSHPAIGGHEVIVVRPSRAFACRCYIPAHRPLGLAPQRHELDLPVEADDADLGEGGRFRRRFRRSQVSLHFACAESEWSSERATPRVARRPDRLIGRHRVVGRGTGPDPVPATRR